MPDAPPTHAMTFDIEDWFHLVGTRILDQSDSWDALASVTVRHTEWILETLATHNTRATFFVLGWIADKYPALVRQIAEQGHELATHSYWHRAVYSMTPEQFRDDLRRSIDAVGAAGGGATLRGFRAPAFSIKPGCEWAFDHLLDEGLVYDASLFPAPRAHGGYACPPGPHDLTTPSNRTLRELPMSTMSLMGKTLAFSGGGYLRVLPWTLIRRGMAQCESRGVPAVVYLHPWDFAVDCPVPEMSRWHRFKCYHGRSGAADKLTRLLDGWRWDTCARVLGLPDNGPA
ncbi:MAG: polysaccharide deacetylase family protein [Phycisphaerales bacterium JB063]